MSAMRSTIAERERLLDDFIRLCEIESPSKRERNVADVVRGELESLGLEVEEDDSGADTGSEAGNLLARIPGPQDSPTILLCAHLDTVPLSAPVEVIQDNRVLTNRHEGILGADNKAAVATILSAARRLAAEGSPIGVELLFTTCEEMALAGAKAFDRGRLRSDFGFVFDHASPVGELVLASPTYYRLELDFRGQAAHAGIRPEDGHNAIAAAAQAVAAMEIGRLDEATTANVGEIAGGTAANVVAERCQVVLEVRSLDDSRAGEVVSSMVDAATGAASDTQCDVETTVERLFRGYRLQRSAPGRGDRRPGASGLRHRAASHQHRRGQRRQRPDRRRPADGEHGQRNRAQPPARRVGYRRCARDHARRDPVNRGSIGARMNFERIDSRKVWEGRVATVRVDCFRYEDGEESEREIVAHPGAVAIVAHDGETLFLVRQPREAVGEPALLELPAGKLDEEGEDPLDTAKRELAEEIGKGARTWRKLTSFYTSPGFANEECHVYLATDLFDQAAESAEDERIEIVEVPLSDLDHVIQECSDSKTLIGLLWLRCFTPPR